MFSSLNSLFGGIAFTILTGVIWTVLGAVYSGVASKQKSIVSFMFFSTVFFALLIWIFRFPREISSAELGRVALAMIPAGLCGIAGFQMLFWAMRKGSHAVAWTFTQSAMVLPFLGGWLIFHQAVKWFNFSGLLLIISALCALGISQNKRAERKNSLAALCLCVGAMFIQGMSQFCTLLPGEWGMSEAALSWRLPLLALNSLAVWTGAFLALRPGFDKETFKMSGLYSFVTAAGQVTLYFAIDALTPAGMTGIVYPAAISICIMLFALYCALFRKEKITSLACCGLLQLLGGVILLFWH